MSFGNVNGNGNTAPRKCKTAFVVVVDEEGNAVATPDLTVHLELERSANNNDMLRACAEVERDILSSQTAGRVMQLLAAVEAQARGLSQIRDLGDLRRGQS